MSAASYASKMPCFFSLLDIIFLASLIYWTEFRPFYLFRFNVGSYWSAKAQSYEIFHIFLFVYAETLAAD